METKIISVSEANLDPLGAAAQLLKNGGLVAFPTETVYGLGAVYNNPSSILQIFAVKGRPADNPLIVHIWRLEQLQELTDEVSAKAIRLIESFWPGPLTLIFRKKQIVSPVVSAGLDSIAVRMPAHPVAAKLLQLTGIPVAAPSANLSGRPSPTRGSHVILDLAGKIDLIIDAGPASNGIESTVLSTIHEPCVILRPGSVTKEMIEDVLHETVDISGNQTEDRPVAPGMKYRHYAPEAPLFLVEGDNGKVVSEINRLLAISPDRKAVVIGSTENIGRYHNEWVLDYGPRRAPEIIAARLYEILRFCDQLPIEIIYVEGVDTGGVGLAVVNRIRKAAGGNIIHVS